MRVDLKNEFRHALIDGLGKEVASRYQLSMVSGKSTAIALSDSERKVLLLVLGLGDEVVFSRIDYLEMARVISESYDCFVVPAQTVEPQTLWAGKTQGPVIVYPFTVLDSPLQWPKKWPDQLFLK